MGTRTLARLHLGRTASLASLISVGYAACAAPSAPGAGLGPTLEAARYELAWERGAAETFAGGVRITNDLGYEVVLSRGHLVTYATSLAECDAGEVSAWLAPLAPAVAHAGHGDELDPSTTAGTVEDLVAGASTELGPITFAPKAYCRAHWVVAPADASTAGATDAAMEGASLVLEGRWAREGASGTFAWRSTIASGALEALPELPDGAVRVTVLRSLDTLLDEIEFSEATAATAGRAVLLNLARQTVITAEAD